MHKNQETLFTSMAHDWWDPEGSMALLHAMNPLRISFVQKNTQAPKNNLSVLDIGCGAGILSESLAQAGYQVTGIDPNDRLIKTAKVHAKQQNVCVDYQTTSASDYLKNNTKRFDIVICSEVLEHVENPQALFEHCHTLCKPDGHIIASTISQTPTAFFKAIVAAEYLFKWIPQGTHSYVQFIKPSTMIKWARSTGRTLTQLSGIEINPWQKSACFTTDVSMQYIACFK